MLEKILVEYFNLKDDVYSNEGGFTRSGERAYSDLISLLYDLGNLTNVDVNEIVDNLDEIVAEIQLLER